MTQQELVNLLEKNNLVVKRQLFHKENNRNIEDITYNSKDCRNGSVFFAKGVNFRKEYVVDAIEKGAFIIISEQEFDVNNAGNIVVSDVRRAMVIVAEEFFDKSYNKLNMIGLTGTKGKTTTATFIHNILNEHCQKRTGLLSTIETYTGIRDEESHLSTPEAIELQRYIKEAADGDLKYLTMEVSSQAYKKERILNMPFDIGMFLNISEDHISPAEHPNFNDYLNSKLKFISNCKKVVVNYETDYLETVLDAAKNAEEIITFGSEKAKNNVNYYYTNIVKEHNSLKFDIVHNGKTQTYSIQMMGEFNVQNALAAIVVANELKITNDVIKEGIYKTTVAGRMNVYSSENKTIIVDYAHNKLSFEKFFEAVKGEYPASDIISVFGAPGGKAYGRRKDMAQVASKCCNYIYLTADDPQFESVQDICNELATFIECDYEIIEDRKDAIEKAYEKMKPGSVLCLLAKGEDRYQQIKGKFEDYESDTDIAKRLTKNM